MPFRKLSPDASFFLALVLLAVALYVPAFGIFFSLDDFEFLLRAAGHEPWPEGLRRLISTRLFFEAGWSLFGERAGYYHGVQLALHLASAWMILLLARRLKLSPAGGRMAAALFLATPVAFTSLHWISGVQELAMAFFALLAAWLALGDGRARALGALAAFTAALLCKESAVLLLPGMALLLPMPRERRMTLGVGGLALAILILFGGGAFSPKPSGDPYETGFGLNLLWNLLTYSAWLVRPWDYFPDRAPQFQQGLALWGLLLPTLLAFAFWRLRDARGSLMRATALFLLLLLPVLPLLRHSYFYYLYLPLIPMWLLAGEGLSRLAAGRRWMLFGLIAVFALGTALLGSERRHAEMGGGLIDDPMIRYATLAETAVATMEADEAPKRGDLLILVPFLGGVQDLGGDAEGGVKVQFLPVDRALLGGRALKLFFPEIRSARFAHDFPESDAWRRQSLWWTYGQGNLAPLGEGEGGRHVLARLFFEKGAPARAGKQLQALLELHPGDPNLLYDLARVALAMGERERAEEILGILARGAGREGPSSRAGRAHRDLEALLEGP